MTEESTTKSGKRVNVGSPVNITRGFNLTIDCVVINGTLPIFLSWIRNNNISLSKSMERNSSSFTINVTDAHDGNNITCRADNSIGSVDVNTTINVQGM